MGTVTDPDDTTEDELFVKEVLGFLFGLLVLPSFCVAIALVIVRAMG